MNTKTSAHYQREYRKRLREQGLVKREVWIHPENTSQLSAIEKKLRIINTGNPMTGTQVMTNNLDIWTTHNLFNALQKTDLITGKNATIEIIDGIDPAIHIVMNEYGDLPIFLTASGEQIIVESVLWSTTEINDQVAFNEAILRTHKYFPLSTISLDRMSNGDEYYHMFGALSSNSLLEHILYEIEVLANNVIQATSAYSSFLDGSIEANS